MYENSRSYYITLQLKILQGLWSVLRIKYQLLLLICKFSSLSGHLLTSENSFCSISLLNLKHVQSLPFWTLDIWWFLSLEYSYHIFFFYGWVRSLPSDMSSNITSSKITLSRVEHPFPHSQSRCPSWGCSLHLVCEITFFPMYFLNDYLYTNSCTHGNLHSIRT